MSQGSRGNGIPVLDSSLVAQYRLEGLYVSCQLNVDSMYEHWTYTAVQHLDDLGKREDRMSWMKIFRLILRISFKVEERFYFTKIKEKAKKIKERKESPFIHECSGCTDPYLTIFLQYRSWNSNNKIIQKDISAFYCPAWKEGRYMHFSNSQYIW